MYIKATIDSDRFISQRIFIRQKEQRRIRITINNNLDVSQDRVVLPADYQLTSVDKQNVALQSMVYAIVELQNT